MTRRLKEAVQDYWDASSCGEVYAVGTNLRDRFENQAATRYELEPYLERFARFEDASGQDVLEVGVGMGADHVRLAQAGPASLTGVDLTQRAVEWTRDRMGAYELGSGLAVGDAENLPFRDARFSFVYSWGVLHHSPDTQAAIHEVYRVLRPGGRARIMVYHHHSIVGYLLWVRYALLRGRPRTPLATVYAEHLESPGTKAFTEQEARTMFSRFAHVEVRTQLSFGDLLLGAAGQQHGGALMAMAKRVWPRRLIQRFLSGRGLVLLVDAEK